MSRFNRYSARQIDNYVFDTVLDRGERLRNAVVQSILSYDNLQCKKDVELENLPKETSSKLKAFLQGDFMTRSEEITALDTLRSMSAADLCKVTDQTYRSDEKCDCWELRDNDVKVNSVTAKLQQQYRAAAREHLKYVDSLKVTVNSIVLNDSGERTVFETFAKDRVVSVSQAFFVEYKIPEVLFKKPSTKAKVNSGIDLNTTRLCSRRPNQQPVVFKQTNIHDIANLDEVDLDGLELRFRVSVRSFKQKHPVCLGWATFNFSLFRVSKNFNTNVDLSIVLNDSTPLVLGTLKVNLQLGCGRLYFGKEFIDALSSNKENWITIGDDYENLSQISTRKLPKDKAIPEDKIKQVQLPETISSTSLKSAKEKFILFGSVYIPQAQFCRELSNTFVRCRLFNQDDEVSSTIIPFSSNPYYNFHQVVPLIYEETLLLQFRENYMVIEFFERSSHSKEFLIGFTKIPLHQFYLTFRNEVIVKYFAEKKLPVIGVDGWEAILSAEREETVGHVQILIALGFKEQIDQLELERGFKSDVVKAKPYKPVQSFAEPVKLAKTIAKVDVAVQSQSNMNPDEIEAIFNKLMAQRRTNNHVEMSTNTEPSDSDANPNAEVKSTSDLLDSLEHALTIESPKSFKAHVAINSALHLPSRKKCKTRKSKGKSGKAEDILPSTYVTFECGKELKMTQVVPKSTSPQWDFKCDVSLSTDYLTNSQKSLIFKVWRKSTNTTLIPNMQTDVVLGFVTLDLTVLSSGLPNIQGWFNIIDLTKKCHGQINIHVTPLENVTKYQSKLEGPSSTVTEAIISEDPNDTLGRALKRKFTELDEITQRLRLRLSKVTNDESDTSNDELADEFERDINNICIEDDFDTVDFEHETSGFNTNRTEDTALLATDLMQNKQKIDNLLENLSLFSKESTSRYVSGCSEGRIDAEGMLNALDHNSRPNIFTQESFNRCMEEKFASSMSEESDFRSAPEGDASSETTKSD